MRAMPEPTRAATRAAIPAATAAAVTSAAAGETRAAAALRAAGEALPQQHDAYRRQRRHQRRSGEQPGAEDGAADSRLHPLQRCRNRIVSGPVGEERLLHDGLGLEYL